MIPRSRVASACAADGATQSHAVLAGTRAAAVAPAALGSEAWQVTQRESTLNRLRGAPHDPHRFPRTALAALRSLVVRSAQAGEPRLDRVLVTGRHVEVADFSECEEADLL